MWGANPTGYTEVESRVVRGAARSPQVRPEFGSEIGAPESDLDG